ncbi:MAG: ParA family protein [Synergistaceae bacterium]|jgi:chromosome partitioning protein|nr:ParA family protein [Synergistaceae bacterium]
MDTSIIIAIANQKGGVAKTTTTASVAAALKRRGFRVLTIDLDPQGNLSDSLGAEMFKLPTTYELLKRVSLAPDVTQHLDACDIIPSNIMLAGIEQELLSETGKEYRLKETLRPISDRYDYILIDTPPSLGVLTINALTCADKVIIPTTAGIFAANGIQQLNNTILNIKKYCNQGLQPAGILLTKFNPRTMVGQEMKELTRHLGQHINTKVFHTFIRVSVAVEEAQANKLDLFSYRQDSTVAQDYNAFVQEYLEG